MVDSRKLSKALRSPGRCRGVDVPAVLDISTEFLWASRQAVVFQDVIREVMEVFVGDGLVEDSVTSVRQAVASIMRKYTRYTNFELQLHTQYIRGSSMHRNTFLSRVEDAIGVDVSDLLSDRSVDMVVRNRIRSGLRLVKKLDRFTVNKIAEAILAGIKSPGQIDFTELFKARGIVERRAKFIARDQMGKLYANLSQARQEDIGVTRYRWSTVRDGRVRARHAERDGKEYYWKRPPAGGHPGVDINCRCVAEPVLESSQIVRDLRAA